MGAKGSKSRASGDGGGGSVPFEIAGWVGYNERFNGLYVPSGETRDGRPVFKHMHTNGVGAGHDWCRMYWAHGYWKIGHVSWVHPQPHLCCAGVGSKAMHPSEIPAHAQWYEHKGTSAGHDFSGNPKDFKPQPGRVHIVKAGGGDGGGGGGGGGGIEYLGLTGRYFSFATGGSPSDVVDRFEARIAGNRVTYYRGGTPHESYEIHGNQLRGPVTATIKPNGDIEYSHGYTSRKEGGAAAGGGGGSPNKIVLSGGWPPRMGEYEADGYNDGKARFRNKTCQPQTWHNIVYSSKFGMWQIATNPNGQGGKPLYVSRSTNRVSPELPPSEGWVLHENENTEKYVKGAAGRLVLEFMAGGGGGAPVDGGGARVDGVTHCKPGPRLTYAESEAYASKMGGRLLTLEEAKALMGGRPLCPGEDQWCAVQGRDWVQVGDRHHHPGKSHNRECGGYPPWGDDSNNRKYGVPSWNYVALYKAAGGGASHDRESSGAQLAVELAQAAWDGDLGRVRSLLDRGAPPNTEAFGGFSNGHHSALNAAARNGHAAIVSLLLEQPRHPEIESRCQAPWEVTPLQQAGYHGRADCARILLRYGASTSSRSGPGCGHKTAKEIAMQNRNGQWQELVAAIDAQEARGSSSSSSAEAPPVVMGMVVESVPAVQPAAEPMGVAPSKGPAPMTLIQQVEVLKRELGLEGNVKAVIEQAAEQLGMSAEGKPLSELGNACMEALGH